MPTYEYLCHNCDHGFEVQQRITDNKLKKCPSCGKMKLVRQVGTGNFILKGGGWYKDLYSSVPKGKSSSSEGEGGGTSKDDSGAKSDSGGKDDTKSQKADSSGKGDTKSSKGDAASTSKGSAKAKSGS